MQKNKFRIRSVSRINWPRRFNEYHSNFVSGVSFTGSPSEAADSERIVTQLVDGHMKPDSSNEFATDGEISDDPNCVVSIIVISVISGQTTVTIAMPGKSSHQKFTHINNNKPWQIPVELRTMASQKMAIPREVFLESINVFTWISIFDESNLIFLAFCLEFKSVDRSLFRHLSIERNWKKRKRKQKMQFFSAIYQFTPTTTDIAFNGIILNLLIFF